MSEILLIIMFLVTGFMILNLVNEEKKLSSVLLYSVPIGIAFHTMTFLLLSLIKVYYSQGIFVFVSLLPLLLVFKKKIRKDLFNFKNDLKHIPIYYILFVGYVLFRLFVLTSTSFFDYYNWDELSSYQYFSKIHFLTKDFGSILYYTFAPLNYLIGVLSYNSSGFDLAAPRIIFPLFFGLISFFIYIKLTQYKVNKHISALLAMMFLISSSEAIILAKTFYTNLIFSLYVTFGLFLIVEHYFINNKQNVPKLGYILLFSAILTRRDGLLLVTLMTLFIFLLLLVRKNRYLLKNIILISVPFIWQFFWSFMKQVYDSSLFVGNSGSSSNLNLLWQKLQPNNLTSFFDQLYRQTFKFDEYFFNYMIFVISLISIILLIVSILKKRLKKNIIVAFSVLVIAEMMYIGIVISTQLLLFSIDEFRIAASVSRYIMAVLPFNYIILGTLLFYNTEKGSELVEMKDKELKKIISPRVLLIIPAYNEEENILGTYNCILEHNKKSELKYDVIVINDGSRDATGEVCKKNNIMVINLIHNLGIGGAVQTGYKYAHDNDYDIAVQFDGDGQHDVESVEDLIKPIVDGQADFVIGSRFVSKMENFKSTRARRIGISIISFVIKIITGKKVYDTTSGFRACNKEIIESFALYYPTEYPEPVTTVELLKREFIIKEVPAKMKERIGGTSSIKSLKNIYYMINVILSIIVVGLRRYK